jgi:hypothetical protein
VGKPVVEEATPFPFPFPLLPFPPFPLFPEPFDSSGVGDVVGSTSAVGVGLVGDPGGGPEGGPGGGPEGGPPEGVLPVGSLGGALVELLAGASRELSEAAGGGGGGGGGRADDVGSVSGAPDELIGAGGGESCVG